MPDKRQAYIAGPYTSEDHRVVCDHVANAALAAVLLARRGILPIVPHTMGSHRITWEKAMEKCDVIFQALEPGRDLVILLPGWENSKGACVEREWAKRLGLEVRELHEFLFSLGAGEAVA